jgi:Ca-activated chloride channel family protein
MRRTFILLVLLFTACTQSKLRDVDLIPAGSGGAVRGMVTDPSGNPLPGVTVTLHRPSGNQTVVTNAEGKYALLGIAPGTYGLDIELPGFRRESVSVRVTDGKVLPLITRLDNSVSEAITVAAAAPLGVEQGVVSGVAGGPVSASFQRIAATLPSEVPKNMANYASIAENAYVDTNKERVTTFSIDVDGASYANVRRFLTTNLIPPPDAVRIEEMVNYFAYNYASPTDGHPFAVNTEVAGCPWDSHHRLLRLGIQGKSIDAWKLAPNNLVFLLDVSGSMQPPERLPLLKSAFRLLVDQLRAEDTVAIVVYAGAAGLALPPTSGADKPKILEALDRLNAGGSTAGGAGIELAYKVAGENASTDRNNRVILATDGDFNVGTRSIPDLTRLIEEKRKNGIYLTCIGVGTDNLNDALMESLADKGNGNYYYLDTINEAKKVFVHQLQGTLVAIAKDVKVQLEFNPALVSSYRQIGYEDRALANQDFEDDSKDAGELGSGHSVTALYEIATKGTGTIATLRLRYKEPASESSQLMSTPIVDSGKSMYEASPDMQFTAAVAEFGMLLRNSKYKGSSTYADVLALARAMRGSDLQGYREEFLRMVETSRTLSGESPQAIARQ